MSTDSLEVLLTASLLVSTVLLMIIGIQLIFLLRQVSRIVRRIDFVSREAERLTEALSRSAGSLQGALQSVGMIGGFIRQFIKRRERP